LVHKISIESECQSKAKLLWGRRKTKRYLLGANYEIKFKFRNDGEKEFPGGRANIWIDYTSGQRHFMGFPILKIEKNGELQIEKIDDEKIEKSALGKGYALFNGEITAKDGEDVQLVKYGQELPKDASFHAIFIETREDVYSYYSLIISACALATLVFFSILQLIF